MKTPRSKRYDHVILGEHFRINLFKLSYDDKLFLLTFEKTSKIFEIYLSGSSISIFHYKSIKQVIHQFFYYQRNLICAFIKQRLRDMINNIKIGKEINGNDKKLYLLCLPKVGEIIL